MIGVGSGLYIGCVSDLKDAQGLTDAGVTHILTVDSEEPAVPGFHTKFVRVVDDASTDLLSRLDDCVSFICDVLSSHSESKSSSVLVHCHVGQSGSAAVVAAYLMKTQHLNLQDAYTKLRNLKPDVKMNEEFMDQLALYELMDCKVDTTNPLYKQFRLKKITEKYPELQNMPKDVFAVDPAQTQNAEAVYRCRKCRRTLFRHSSILSHSVGSGASAFSHKKTRIVSDSEDQRQCTSHFIEPVQWMEPALLGVMDGQLLCPKCSSKLGSFNWYGEQCSCGRWVTPAFQMHKNRVDEIKHISISALK
ncbi:dual specificity protein phosphatase 12-like [Cyprinus carpio]|uniref:Dual specificity protein phosphatase 12 n=2 Tax=Cyprinus carpio TaxID=7962 RepID=A0A9Q9ZV21_CYPCA|nr:dual specificity protein phosphatase 12-like [Cyprinus carpio]XP_042574010.1 dual specificity protein phosphatase 12-like [Cyprinus carpio]XP_042574011.1 dual specificity protein phosphatase 12-like [Cyprinus carpio]